MKFPWTRSRSYARVQLTPLAIRRKITWRRWIRRVGWPLLGLVVIFGLLGLYYYPKARPAIAAAREANAIVHQLPKDLADQNFVKARQDVKKLRTALDRADSSINKMQGLRSWPYLGRQYQAVDQLLAVGQNSTEAVKALVDFADHLFAPFADRGQVSLASLSADEKGQLLAGIAEQEATLRQAQVAIDRAAADLEKIPERGLIGPLHKIIAPLKEQFPAIQEGLAKAVPAARILPTILGYPDPKTYLFLLENNTELRPGGGFIGTYGIMRLASGEIASLATDNSYNLDEAAKRLPRVAPPEPISRYLKVNNWYFRDANWSPDFPTSAQQALLLYKREGGQKNVDGVMAVTPTAIAELLNLVGPITIDNLEFTSQNFTDQLQRYVDHGFATLGLGESERKDIIGPLTNELVDRLLKLPVSDWGKLFLTIGQALNEKQLLIYAEDPVVETILENQNWAGALATAADSDYLTIIDANLASLKTDPTIERTYTYKVHLQGDQADATLTVHYRHTGNFDWKTTRYNTFLRVYVPAGAVLLDSRGAQLREKSNKAGDVTTTTELGKTVFSAFKSIEPQTDSDVVLHYQLPESALASIQRDNEYRLTWQKQPGMLAPKIIFEVQADNRNTNTATGLDNQARLRKDSLNFSGSLAIDRQITLRFR